MKLINKNINTLTMKYPSSWHGALWREGLLSGNGKIGVNVYGGVKRETVIINHAGLWSGKPRQELPDVSSCLAKTRAAMDSGRFGEASRMLADALKESGYDNERGYPLPLAEMNITLNDLPGFSDYLRAVNMETGEVSTQFNESGVWVRKDLFVSRKDDIIIMRIRADEPVINAEFTLDLREDSNNSEGIYQYIKSKRSVGAEDNILTFSSVNTDDLPFGAAARIEIKDGAQLVKDNSINICGCSEILIKIKVYINGDSSIDALINELKNESGDYEYYLDRHAPLHKALYSGADLSLCGRDDRSNEELLLDAYAGESPNELIEKLWRFGRYLFISGSCADGLPFTMYGLWPGEYRQMWSHNMANENVQMIYWHTNVGNLEELNKPLFEYYNSRMEYFKESAKKLYGCNGIFVPAGTTPNMPLPNQIVPVILNWTGAAGWIAQHYYKHYLHTRDTEYLHSTLLPFMKAAADFYEDFIVFDENGKVKIYPSISPENTPLNFIPKDNPDMAHPMPTTINSTIDIAIIKELFTNLIKISEERDIYPEKTDLWRKIVSAMPEYKINSDGAVKEWQDERFYDRYYHRHLSHIYPVFPGEEITTQDSLITAFEKAVDLREIGAQTGWSLAHMASVYARFGRGNDAMRCLNNIAKTCMLSNLLTLHNDWRRMDISLEMDSSAPIQLDAAMGYVNAVQEMILYSSQKLIKLLPALSENLKQGRISGWRFCGGSITMEWDISQNTFSAELSADRDIEIDIVLPEMFNHIVSEESGNAVQAYKVLHVNMSGGSVLKLMNKQ